MTSCQKENVQDLVTLKTETESVEYSTNPIEYTTLEKMNEAFIKHGLAPTTLEELGITQKEYDVAQARLNDPNIAKSRCSASLTVYYLDMNNNGSLTTLDIIKARRVILGIDPPTSDSALFGYASAIWPTIADGASGPPANPNLVLTTWDLVLAQRIILGIYVCQ